MNPIERLRDDLTRRFPDIAIEVDPPADAAGLWLLDVRPGGGAPWIVVEWKPELGVGISTPGAADYGTKPDEVYPNASAAYGRVIQIILSGGATEPPAAVRLAELRRWRKLSAAEVAGRAGIKQSAIGEDRGAWRHSSRHPAPRCRGDGRPALDPRRIPRRYKQGIDRARPDTDGGAE